MNFKFSFYQFIIGLFLFSQVPDICQAQIVFTPNVTANLLIDRLVGVGITYTNATLTCPLNASGKFDNGLASTVLIDSGVVLTTGRVVTSGANIGVNGSGSDFASVNNITNGGDIDLPAAAGTTSGNIHDLCKLEFDFVPTGDTIQFKYRFGSEEYPNYNCSQYNDIFAFFISGPGYAVPTNVALVPGTTIPVTINSINNGTISPPNGGVLTNCTSLGAGSPFTSLYVNNTTSTSITYNGLTSLLTAKAAVTPCSTYHMKFAIADVSDHIYDSGVFLQAGSFSSDIASVISVSSSNTLASPNPFAVEGCSPAVITIARPLAKPYPQTVTYTLSGTATNGVDVTTLSGSVTIPAFATTCTITVNAIADGIIEGTESLIFAINGSLCGGAVTETLTMLIQDYPSYTKPLNDTICNGQSSTLSATPLPANPNLTFSWSPSSTLSSSTGTTVTATPTSTTTYTITSSYPGCPSVDSTVTLSIDPTPTLTLTPSNITCAGATNGAIVATGSASNPMSISISPGSITSSTSPFTFSSLGAGTYTVTITSGAGCTKTSTATITAPPSMVWQTTNSINPICAGNTNGSIQVSATGGTGTVNYTLLPSTTNTTGNFPSLGTGVYTVNAVDANGCSISTTFNLVSSNPVIWASVSSNNIAPCFGASNGSIAVSATGGSGSLTYILSPIGTTNTTGSFNGLGPSNYTVQASDINGCSNSTVLTIIQPIQVQITNLTSTPINCNGVSTGGIHVTASGGTGVLNYLLQPLGTTNTTGIFSSLASSVYTVVVTDAIGCSVTSIVNLTQPTAIQFTSFTINNVACNGGSTGSIIAIASGGTGSITYTLQPSGITSTTGSYLGLPASTYTVVASDANGCSISSVANLIQQPLLVINPPILTQVACHGDNTGSIQITTTGGTGSILFQMMPGSVLNNSGSFTNLVANVYTITATDILGCSNSTLVTITQPSSLYFGPVNIVHPSCANLSNGSIALNGTGGTPSYQFALNTGSFSSVSSFTNLALGTYSIHIKDNQGCLHDSVVTLVPLSNLSITNVSVQDVYCKYDLSGSISVSTIGGVMPYLYQLNGSAPGLSASFNSLGAGSYSIHVIDSIGCIADTILPINEPLLSLQFNNINITDVKCYGDATGIIQATAFGGTSPIQYSLNGGTYQATGYYNGLTAGNYTITIKDFYGCLQDTIIVVQQPLSPISIHLNNLTEITCIGLKDGAIEVGASGGVKPYVFSINGSASTNDSSFVNLNFGTYIIEVTDANGCRAAANYVIAIPTKRPYILIDSIKENICKGDLNAFVDWSAFNGFPPYQYTFNTTFIDSISAQQNLLSGTYTISLIDSKGCKTDTSILITNSTSLDVIVQTIDATCTGDGNDGKAIAIPSGGVDPYRYQWVGYLDQTPSISDVQYGQHMLIIKDDQNCADTAMYTINYIPCCALYMPNAFSPNNDGHNDIYRMIPYGVLDIKSFDIFNRWGEKIFTSNSMEGSWDGKFKGVDSEIGTYYYLVKYYCQLSKELETKYGDFTLLR